MKIKVFLVSLIIIFPLVSSAAEPAPLDRAARLILEKGEIYILEPIISTYFKVPFNAVNPATRRVESVGGEVAVPSADGKVFWWVLAFENPGSAKISILIMECARGLRPTRKGIDCKEELIIWSTSQSGVLEKAGIITWPIKDNPKAISIELLTRQSELDKFPEIVKTIQAWAKSREKKEMVKL